MTRFQVVVSPSRHFLQCLLAGLVVLAGLFPWRGFLSTNGRHRFDLFLVISVFGIVLAAPWIGRALHRSPAVWLEAGRLYVRASLLQPIRSVPLNAVSPRRILIPSRYEFWFTGVSFRGSDGSWAAVPVRIFSALQLRDLAQAIEVATASAV
jgi:hypothetical protein